MDRVVQGLDFVYAYIDDVPIAGRSEEEHVLHLKQVFERFQQYGIVINSKHESDWQHGCFDKIRRTLSFPTRQAAQQAKYVAHIDETLGDRAEGDRIQDKEAVYSIGAGIQRILAIRSRDSSRRRQCESEGDETEVQLQDCKI
ncbi:hypothetical protein T265_06692 [Opisthorchis viverrini]|uniref:Reverse transcriptase domain-containing protein n=1 Tax=Opisthorchis viverrini TaxID=6198 RepID=A0A075ADA2_OPIVI|nr:hypothetical protein T265_06692 [Opisthorchis viverrini]KER25939.1 hypothetical protein T265_06692 [Opisthorchis viverrini]